MVGFFYIVVRLVQLLPICYWLGCYILVRLLQILALLPVLLFKIAGLLSFVVRLLLLLVLLGGLLYIVGRLLQPFWLY